MIKKRACLGLGTHGLHRSSQYSVRILDSTSPSWRASAMKSTIFQRAFVAAPKPGGPPILERREDRDLPDVTPKRTYLWSIPLFFVLLTASAAAIFNYQRSSSSVVSSTLYALRVNPQVRELLGDEIQFKAKMPWITGTMDQMHGRIDISYAVKGTKGEGIVYFKSTRHGGKHGLFKTVGWELETMDGEKVKLLVDEEKLAFDA